MRITETRATLVVAHAFHFESCAIASVRAAFQLAFCLRVDRNACKAVATDAAFARADFARHAFALEDAAKLVTRERVAHHSFRCVSVFVFVATTAIVRAHVCEI